MDQDLTKITKGVKRELFSRNAALINGAKRGTKRRPTTWKCHENKVVHGFFMIAL